MAPEKDLNRAVGAEKGPKSKPRALPLPGHHAVALTLVLVSPLKGY